LAIESILILFGRQFISVLACFLVSSTHRIDSSLDDRLDETSSLAEHDCLYEIVEDDEVAEDGDHLEHNIESLTEEISVLTLVTGQLHSLSLSVGHDVIGSRS
jgi:hypothetical protein